MSFHFEYAEKSDVDEILPSLFLLLYENMQPIAPFDKSFDDAFSEWAFEVSNALKKDPRRLALMYCGCQLIGFCMYYVNNGVFMMEEIQIKKEFQGSGVFRLFYCWLIQRLPSDILSVEAFTHTENLRSQQILEHLGLLNCGDVQNGKFFHYKGNYSVLLDKYSLN